MSEVKKEDNKETKENIISLIDVILDCVRAGTPVMNGEKSIWEDHEIETIKKKINDFT